MGLGLDRTCRQAAVLVLAVWTCRPAPPGDWHDEGAYRWRDLPAPGGRRPGFRQLAASVTGIDFSNAVSQASMRQNRHLVQGAGVALGDFDADGLVDIYLARIEGPNALYRNLGGWRFQDLAAERGVAALDRFSTGATFADVDGDKDLDLLVSAMGGPNALFVNDGTGHFRERTGEAGLASDRGSTTMTLADVDGDGDLDLYIANYKVATVLDRLPPEERAFDQVVQRTGTGYSVAPKFQADYRVQVRPDLGVVVRTERADPDWFYLNDGHGRFERVPLTSGRFLTEAGARLKEEPEWFSLTASFRDTDGDGDPDLYVCNDFEDPDQLWINDGTGTFRAAPAEALRNTSNASMAVDFSDIDRDGDLDFFVVDMLSRDPVRRNTQRPTHTALPKLIGRTLDRPQLQRNTLNLNRGDGTFAEVAHLAGVEASDWSWATLFLDVDLDGFEDILVATGHTWDVMDADIQARLSTSRGRVNWRDERFLFPALALRNVAFRNQGDLTFREMGSAWGFAQDEDISHGLAAGDLDNDGDLDVVINRLGHPAGVFRNDAPAPRVLVRLVGRSPNTQGVGAKVRLLGGPVPVQEKEVVLGGLYLSSSDPSYAFAAGDADQLGLEVVWRNGTRTVVPGVRSNRLYEIREDSAPPQERGPTDPGQPAVPFFADVSDLLSHTHVEAPFDDFGRQPLLPHSLSQLGPGLAWYDADADGDEDLIIGTGRGGAPWYFRNHAGKLTQVALPLPASALDQAGVLGVVDGDGHPMVLMGQANYEASTAADALAAPSVVRLGLAPDGGAAQATAAVPGDTSSTGPLAAADYDGDADLDLFVGGRAIPTAYPFAATSRLFLNHGGRFELDQANLETLRHVGLVSGAIFSDVDGDGDPDLLLALDLGPVKLLLNHGGRFRDRTSRYGLDRYRSRWNGITAGDLDADGRLDIVATSWGRNTKYHVGPDAPLLLYYADFDGNRSVDIVEAQYDQTRRGTYPLDAFPRILSAIPSTGRRIPTFTAYAHATLEQVLGPALRGAPKLEVNTLDHTVFLNRGVRFQAVPLAAEAQFAPAFYAGVADLDGDGHEDLFLSQNFFPTEIGTRRYDAGRGLWLRGDGSGVLRPVPGRQSGILVYGDQRGAALADYNVDGRVDLAISQNGAATKLYRNDGARPGLRVRLAGPRQNPHGIGAVLRLVYASGRGPAREIHAGAGYWSQDGAVQVLGSREPPVAVWVRWPGGRETETRVAPGVQEVTVSMDGRTERRQDGGR